MFTNLIESDLHRKELKRRTSFFLATVAGYLLMLLIAGIIGIYTYDAQVEAQNTDMSIDFWIPPVRHDTPVQNHQNPAPRRATHSNAPIDPHLQVAMRTDPIAPVTDSLKPPDTIGTVASNTPPTTGPVIIGPRNADPPASTSNSESVCETCTGTTPAATVDHTTPPVVTPAKPPTQHVSSSVLVSKVINLPKPGYPLIAKQIRAQGPVNVQILVDESGRVISAHAVNGNPVLVRAAEEAARGARFTPTFLNDQPVKVQGVITYNFVLQ